MISMMSQENIWIHPVFYFYVVFLESQNISSTYLQKRNTYYHYYYCIIINLFNVDNKNIQIMYIDAPVSCYYHLTNHCPKRLFSVFYSTVDPLIKLCENPKFSKLWLQKWFTNSTKISCWSYINTYPAFICSKLTIETVEQGVKYVQSWQ